MAGDNSLYIERIGASLGAEISGIELTRVPDDSTFAAIEAALAEYEVIVFRDQEITTEQQIAFGRRFGELTVHPFAPSDEEARELIVFDNGPDSPPWGTDVWHSDETFRAAPPMATMLRALIVPQVGGDTLYASMTAAYEGLSDRMRQFISGMEAVHDFKPFRQLFQGDAAGREKLRGFEDRYPPAVHPVVRRHPVTGRDSIFVNPQFTLGIKGMDERESRALLDLLFHQAEVPEYQYRHRWRPHTIVIWDNRSVQHYAIHDFFPQRRKLERVTIAGDRPVGADSGLDPASVRGRKAKFMAGTAGQDAGYGGHTPQEDKAKEAAS